MYYILENDSVMRDAEGNKLTYATKDDAKQTIDYFGDDLDAEYTIVSMVDYTLGKRRGNDQ